MFARTLFWSSLVVVASILDLVLTWFLLTNSELAYEANPVAAFVLAQFGWAGLVAFKASTIAFVTGLGLAISFKSPRSALLMFRTAGLLVFAVVAYSVVVLGTSCDPEESGLLENARLRTNKLIRTRATFQTYSRTTEELARALLARRVSLVEATAALHQVVDEGGYNPINSLRLSCGEAASEEACLAAQLVRDVGFLVQDDPETSERTKAWLADEFDAFDMPLPEYSSESFKPNLEGAWCLIDLLQFSLLR